MINWVKQKYIDYKVKSAEIDIESSDKLQKVKDDKLNNDINNIHKSHEKYKLEQKVKTEKSFKNTWKLKLLVFGGALGSGAMTVGGTDVFREINGKIGFFNNPIMYSILVFVLLLVQIFTFYAAKIKPSTYDNFNLHYDDMVLLSTCLIPLSMLCNFRFLSPFFKVFDCKIIDYPLCLFLCFLYDKAIVSFLGYETSRKNLIFSYPTMKDTVENLQKSFLSKINIFKPKIQELHKTSQDSLEISGQDVSGKNKLQDSLQDAIKQDKEDFRISQDSLVNKQDVKEPNKDEKLSKQEPIDKSQEDIRIQDSSKSIENSDLDSNPEKKQDSGNALQEYEKKLQDMQKTSQDSDNKEQDFSGLNPENNKDSSSQDLLEISGQDFSGLNPENKKPENLSKEEKAILVSEMVKNYKPNERIKIQNFKHLGIKGNASDAEWKYIRNYLKEKDLLYVKNRFSYKKAN